MPFPPILREIKVNRVGRVRQWPRWFIIVEKFVGMNVLALDGRASAGLEFRGSIE